MAGALPEILKAVVKNFAYDPVGFVMWAFPWRANRSHPMTISGQAIDAKSGAGLEDWQAELQATIGRELKSEAHKAASCVRASVVSGHGIGKGAMASMLVLWWLLTRPGAKGILSANKLEQAKTKTWVELRKWHNRLRPELRDLIEISAERCAVLLDPKVWFVSLQAWSVDNPSAFQGEHSDFPIVVFDEASEFPQVIYEIAEGIFSEGEGLWLAFGNGTVNKGPFYDSHNSKAHRWIHRSVDSRTIRRPHNAELMDEWVREFGEDSDFVRVRVRGMFPRSGFHQLIDQELITEARQRVIPREAWQFAPVTVGADVANYGGDRTVFTKRQGLYLPPRPCREMRGLDPIQVGDRLIGFCNESGRWPDGVFIDGNGVGAGTVARVREMNYRCINVGQAGSLAAAKSAAARKGAPEETIDLWTMLYCNARDYLRDGGSLMNAPQELVDDLSGREYMTDDRTGMIRLIPKSALDQSPDYGDSYVATFAAKVARRGGGSGSGGGRVGWARPFDPLA